jgi:hypothetical protein
MSIVCIDGANDVVASMLIYKRLCEMAEAGKIDIDRYELCQPRPPSEFVPWQKKRTTSPNRQWVNWKRPSNSSVKK